MKDEDYEVRHSVFFSSPHLPLVPVDSGSFRLACIPACVVLLYNLFLLPAEITGDHAGEFVTAASLLGVSHSPGYPAWTLAAALFASLPVGSSEIWRVALLSTLCLAGSAFLMVILLRQMDVGRRAALVGAFMLAFGSAAWRDGTVPGVGSLELCLFLLMLVFLFQLLATKKLGWAPAVALVAALGVSHHPRFILLAAVAAALGFVRRPVTQLGWKRIAGAALGFSIGLLPLMYLPVRGTALPYLNTGEVRSLSDTARHYLGHYERDVPVTAEEEEPSRALTALDAITTEHAGLGVLLGVAGLIRMWRKSRRDAWAFLLLAAAPVAFYVARGELHPGAPTVATAALFLTTYAVLAALSAYWIDWILQKYGNSPRWRERTLTGLAALLPLCLITVNARAADHSAYGYCADYVKNTLAILPPQSLLFTGGALETYPLLYHQGVLGERQDVLMVDRCGELEWRRLPGLGKSFGAGARRVRAIDLISRLLEAGRPIYATRPIDGELPAGFHWRSVGLLFALTQASDEASLGEEDERAWKSIRFRNVPAAVPEGIGELGAQGAPLDGTARELLALYYGALARKHNQRGEQEDWDRASRLALELSSRNATWWIP